MGQFEIEGCMATLAPMMRMPLPSWPKLFCPEHQTVPFFSDTQVWSNTNLRRGGIGSSLTEETSRKLGD